MATMADLDELCLALPEVERTVADDGRPTYAVRGRFFCLHRSRRADALDPATGERLADVLCFRVDGAEVKEAILADPRGIFFTTPHFDGYPAVLLRIPSLASLARDELRDLVIDAWLTRAPVRVARAWLAANEPDQ